MMKNDILIRFVPTFLEVLALFYFAEHFLTAKVSRIKRYIANTCCYLLDYCAICCFQEKPYIKYAIVVLLIFLWGRYVYQVPITNGIFLSAFQFSYWAIMDLLFISIASFLWGEKSKQPENFYLLYTLIKVAELIIVVAVCRTCCRHRDASWQSNLRILAFPVCVLCVSFYLFSILVEEPQYATKLLGCIMLLLAIDIFSIYLLEHLEEQQYNAALYTSLKQNLQVINANIDSWKEAYMEQRRYTHEFQNKLMVLRGLASKEGTPAELRAYLDELTQYKVPYSYCLDTHRPIVDVLLSQKQALAKSNEIQVRMELDDLSAFPLPDDDLVVVFSNLFDNAIEACKKIAIKNQRKIMFKVKVEDGIGYIYIENTTNEPVKISNNRIMATSKKDSLAHGFGLKNVFCVLDKNQSVYQMSYHKDMHSFQFFAQI